ncbi:MULTISPECIES: DUF4387 domain-containing protein [Pseudomonas]|uniref:DUF4387 domain-containing protein n=1 Tax=Pseudomonas tehranensis TaxID=2745502 RepID=A0ABR6UKQ5_9PSED|nr:MULTISPECIES: DUF4387 domain-containing protein [Pseudomonas]MBC3345104.1 DUF4387 domain-containing protein [Pseudomonas tehranensis]SEO04967.1 protein of unknown function [Pseudomonas sp. NFACC39-1]SFG87868.1 protein of unknown function [Pseudomonas sp. NFACC45]
MVKLRDVCRHVRSKQAGPFWITFDIFFDGRENFERYSQSAALSSAQFARLYGTDPARVKHIPVADLEMVKISYPRATPQGGMVERDMHAGQQYVRLLDVVLD